MFVLLQNYMKKLSFGKYLDSFFCCFVVFFISISYFFETLLIISMQMYRKDKFLKLLINCRFTCGYENSLKVEQAVVSQNAIFIFMHVM